MSTRIHRFVPLAPYFAPPDADVQVALNWFQL
jgi:hypothetical protein